jgi:hypothetical protein
LEAATPSLALNVTESDDLVIMGPGIIAIARIHKSRIKRITKKKLVSLERINFIIGYKLIFGY